jgi:hypothetical protein
MAKEIKPTPPSHPPVPTERRDTRPDKLKNDNNLPSYTPPPPPPPKNDKSK